MTKRAKMHWDSGVIGVCHIKLSYMILYGLILYFIIYYLIRSYIALYYNIL